MRCPFRVKSHDFPDTCDPKCAWLMSMTNKPDHRACGIAVMAKNNGGKVAWQIVNSEEEPQTFHDEFYDCESTTNVCIPTDPGEASMMAVEGFIREQEAAQRTCPGYDPERHYCNYHAQDFELNDRTVNELKRENQALEAQLDRILHSPDVVEGVNKELLRSIESLECDRKELEQKVAELKGAVNECDNRTAYFEAEL